MSEQNSKNKGLADAEISTNTAPAAEISQLSHAVKHAIRRYLYELDGTQPGNMYELVLRQIEQPLLEAILEHTKGNQSRAAELLGLNRGTLRKKLRNYKLQK